ncbi:S9 family peptidase [Luteimonas saliphila]|uniref:S9 family peptidase n=1 Tax=Luteimonas saliphila TaxID=2804919 RepID=UPI00192DE1CB|nr:prolyl oligopeptidase family serine peptidase [Luteimonas saliphila]
MKFDTTERTATGTPLMADRSLAPRIESMKSLFMSPVFGLLVAIASVFPANATENAVALQQPLDLADVLNMRRIAWYAPVAPSPDGQLVAYVVSRPTEEVVPEGMMYVASGAPRTYAATAVWLTEVATGKSRNLTGDQGANWAASWSPDGGMLAFLSDRDGTAGLWVWERASDSLRRIGDVVPRIISLGTSPEWSPDGGRILLGVLPEGASLLAGVSSGNDQLARMGGGSERTGPTVRVFDSEQSAGYGTGTQNIGQLSSDVALVDVATGKVDRIARGVSLQKAVFSPDGRHVAFSESTGDNVPGTHIQRFSLKLFTLAGGRLQTLVSSDELGHWGRDFSWSPDSRMLAYRLGHDSGEVYLTSLDGQSRPAADAAHPPFSGVPAWGETGEKLLLLSEDAVWGISTTNGEARQLARIPGRKAQMLVPVDSHGDRLWLRDDGRSVVVVVSDGIRKELHRVWLDGGETELLHEERKDYTSLSRYNIVASPASGRIVFVAEDAQHPEDVWISNSELSDSTRLTELNPKISGVSMGALRIVEWTGADGLPYAGALLLPSGYEPGRRYPLVTYVYPTEVVPDANKFGSNHLGNEHFNLQLLATRGYAVLYSGATLRPADKEAMKSVANAVLPGIDHVIGLGIADPQRLGVFGVSAGSYSTLSLIVQTTRFKAAMAQAGPGNLLSLYGDLRDSGYSHGAALNENTFQMPDHPWKDRDRYIRNSPWFFLDKVETPLLLIHGTDDQAAIVNQSNEIFLGLRRLGKTAQYARYAGEGHGLSSLQNRLDAGQRFLAWFDRYLKPEPN